MKQTNFNINEVLEDYKVAFTNRVLSQLGRKEVLTGKAKFGIFSDGKEVAQIAMAKQFKNGDWRAGYYRDQTFIYASNLLTVEEFFAQLYGDTNVENNPSSGGRMMNSHYATTSINKDGTWRNLVAQKNISADVSPTAGQMPRLVGLAYASKLFRKNKSLHNLKQFSNEGNEVAFGTIGDASTAEGHFWEGINAAGVLQIPMALSIWDDGWGISVPKKLQVTNDNIHELLKGFKKNNQGKGIHIYNVKGWDYPTLCQTYEEGIKKCREEHTPVVFHIEEMTQPLGHSTSGSHERYKTRERLDWEQKFDPIKKMKEWILETKLSTDTELEKIEEQVLLNVQKAKKRAWNKYAAPIQQEKNDLIALLKKNNMKEEINTKLNVFITNLNKIIIPFKSDIISVARKVLYLLRYEEHNELKKDLQNWLKDKKQNAKKNYNTHLYSQSKESTIHIKGIPPEYNDASTLVTGREILRENFDYLFKHNPLLVTFGEDTGKLGGVNQSLEGLQKKYGDLRITDTGIREATIIGQGLGLALRGLQPIAEIQYFDYMMYALQTINDDLASTRYRSYARQKAPLIIRTRGHRLEGVWHSGSPLGIMINSMRGVYICVPRNMTQAIGFYNTLLKGDDPALVIEPLNAYRLKEKQPSNIGKIKTPLGIPEIIVEGKDITIVTYGTCVRIAQESIKQLNKMDISVELIDVQTLLPFDIHNHILLSIKKTNKVLFLDEDVKGGATAFMMQKVLEEQEAFDYLEIPAQTLTAKDHRPAYGTDGDYFSKPSADDVVDSIYNMIHQVKPHKYPQI